jgi:hypothetical protein
MSNKLVTKASKAQNIEPCREQFPSLDWLGRVVRAYNKYSADKKIRKSVAWESGGGDKYHIKLIKLYEKWKKEKDNV